MIADDKITIRQYKPSDLEACQRLYLQLVQWHRMIYDDPTIGEPDPYIGLMKQIEEHGEKSLWVAEMDSDVVGLVGLIINGNEAEVEPIVVAESHRRRGIGTQLLNHVTEIARQAEVKYLNIKHVARNWQAVRCSYSAGFRTVGFIELFKDLSGDFKPDHNLEIHGISFDW